MVIDFDPESHIYRVDSRIYPSVTKVLESTGLYPSYPAATREFMLSRGSAIHLACQYHDTSNLGRLDERLEGYVMGWKGFLKDSGFVAELIEEAVASIVFGYAGRIDRVGRLGSSRTIVDLKAGAPPGCAALQTAAYKRALLETLGIHVGRRLAVQVSNDGTYRVTEYENHSEDDRIWLSSLAIFRWKEKNL